MVSTEEGIFELKLEDEKESVALGEENFKDREPLA